MVHVHYKEPDLNKPLFCPNQTCPYHDRNHAAQAHWYHRFGVFQTKTRGPILRFRCRSCGKTCSTQTFSTAYWTHSRWDLEHLEQQLTSASGLRQIARMNNCSYRVVRNRIQRLARQVLFLFAHALNSLPITEDAAFDGFESFIRSQYFPTNINILVGSDSQAVYGVNLVVMRRKGRMTAIQKKNRAIIDQAWKPPRRALEYSTRWFFEDMQGLVRRGIVLRSPWTLHSDEKREYPRALSKVPFFSEALSRGMVLHHRTSSRKKRTRANPLFPVNYLDRLLRKDMGEHVRETVKQGREVNCAMDRLIIKLARHTFFKPHRISNRVDTAGEATHASVAGMDRSEIVRNRREWLYTHRQVYSHLPEPRLEWIRMIWQRAYENPPIVDLKSGEVRTKGQPKEAWFPVHLTA